MRVGLVEMVDVAQRLFPSARPATFFAESCGVADLIATCVAGRNRRAGEALARAGGGKTFAEIEEELAVGSLQGPRTALEVLEVLEADYTLKTALNLLWTAFKTIVMPSRVKVYLFHT